MPAYTLVRNDPSGTQLRRLHFDRAPEGYAHPGQFVAADLGGEQAFFAIASSPGEPLELLVKEEGSVGESVAALVPGAVLQATHALGRGFRAAATRPHPLICLVNGSALSAVRPVIRAELEAGLPRPVTLLYGVLTPDRRAFPEDLSAWAQAGIDVIEVVHAPMEGWDGPTGFIQDEAAARGLVQAEVAVVLCGVPPMVEAARDAFARAGVPDARLLTNY
jgi:CDP-4-dehydro-6-deoxyglucose reductase, E3